MNRGSLKKKDLIRKLQYQNPELFREDVEEIVNLVFDAMTNALAEGRRIEVRGFGNFSVTPQKAREFVNPKTGKLTKCEPGKRVVFRAGKNLVKVLDDKEDAIDG